MQAITQALDKIARATRDADVEKVNGAIQDAYAVDCTEGQIRDAVDWGWKTTPLNRDLIDKRQVHYWKGPKPL